MFSGPSKMSTMPKFCWRPRETFGLWICQILQNFAGLKLLKIKNNQKSCFCLLEGDNLTTTKLTNQQKSQPGGARCLNSAMQGTSWTATRAVINQQNKQHPSPRKLVEQHTERRRQIKTIFLIFFELDFLSQRCSFYDSYFKFWMDVLSTPRWF